MTISRKEGGYRPVNERIYDFGEVEQTLDEADRKAQASRCMDCGVPFCHWACPAGSKIPEWQDALYRGQYREASALLHTTHCFPEITGRICPAPCEKSCVLALHDAAVTIRENECATVEKAFQEGWIRPDPPRFRSGRKIAVIGSGPAGLAAAGLLNQSGHRVTVFEKNDALGGLLRYGIPDFKLAKNILDRRLALLEAEEVRFITHTEAGKDFPASSLLEDYDAVLLAVGALQPRDLAVEGRELEGVCFAMDYLTQQNRIVAGQEISEERRIHARGKRVVIIGGGDTGSDCVGTAIRQKASRVTQIEILPEPPEKRGWNNPWPYWPETLKTSSSHLEGCERLWSLSTRRFTGEKGILKSVDTIGVKWIREETGKWTRQELPGTERSLEADLVLLALGFMHPCHSGLLTDLGIAFDNQGRIRVDERKQTSVPGIFAAGDAEKGASLVVHALEAGKMAAFHIDAFLSRLP